VAVVPTLVGTKQIRINIHKRKDIKTQYKTIQNTVNTSTHITKTHTHTQTHTHITKPTHTHTHKHTHTLQSPHIHTRTHYKTN